MNFNKKFMTKQVILVIKVKSQTQKKDLINKRRKKIKNKMKACIESRLEIKLTRIILKHEIN